MDQETSRRTSASATDPWVSRLLIAVLVTLVFVLTAVVYMVYTGVLTGQAPRTLAEKQIATLDRSFKANPGDPQVVADYMRALVSVERYTKARSVLNTYRSGEASSAAVVTIEEARLLAAQGDDTGALEVADTALDQARAEKEAKIKEFASKGINAPFSSDEIVSALIMKAQVLETLGRPAEAIGALDAALEELPTMADVLVWRGELHASAGDTASARADFEKALDMIPDFEPALDGLNGLEGGTGE